MAGYAHKPDFEAILREAHAAAAQAVHGLPDTGACGFAWVTVSGNSPIARAARALSKAAPPHYSAERFYGSKGYPTGHHWWKPGNFHGQSIAVNEAGARAFREVLAKYGVSAEVGSRLD